MTPQQQAAKLARVNRDAYNAHFGACLECHGTEPCAVGLPLLQAAIREMGDGRK